jgi:hypothetical protein
MHATVTSVPRPFLQEGLRQCHAAPLAPSVRGPLEARFGANFDDVRIHTGPAASALCRTLGARAFTFGRDVVFAEGQYAPDSPAGRRLLAHELVHVLQQRSLSPNAESALVPVGSAGDDCEREADRLAEEALGTGLRSAVTPDAAGAVRRAITLNELKNAWSIDPDAQGAIPDAYVDMAQGAHSLIPFIMFHLTRNKSELVRPGATAFDQRAIEIVGRVKVKAGSQADISSAWEFHFRQYFQTVRLGFEYAGLDEGDGCMTMDIDRPPAVPADFLPDYIVNEFIDKDPDGQPGNGQPQFTQDKSGLWTVTISAVDHPNSKHELVARNYKTKKPNFMYKATKQFEVITGLIAIDLKTKDIHPLGFLQWGATCTASIRWDRDPNRPRRPLPRTPTIDLKDFKVQKTRADSPNPNVTKMITDPATPPKDKTSFALVNAAIDAVRASQVDTPNVTAFEHHTPAVPKDFVT